MPARTYRSIDESIRNDAVAWERAESPVNRAASMFSWFWAAAAGWRGYAPIESQYSIGFILDDIYATAEVIGGNDLLTNVRFCLRPPLLPFEINFNATPPRQVGARFRRPRRHMASEGPSSDRLHGFQEHRNE